MPGRALVGTPVPSSSTTRRTPSSYRSRVMRQCAAPACRWAFRTASAATWYSAIWRRLSMRSASSARTATANWPWSKRSTDCPRASRGGRPPGRGQQVPRHLAHVLRTLGEPTLEPGPACRCARARGRSLRLMAASASEVPASDGLRLSWSLAAQQPSLLLPDVDQAGAGALQPRVDEGEVEGDGDHAASRSTSSRVRRSSRSPRGASRTSRPTSRPRPRRGTSTGTNIGCGPAPTRSRPSMSSTTTARRRGGRAAARR